jgi:uncharacterized protein (TIGR03382 family)
MSLDGMYPANHVTSDPATLTVAALAVPSITSTPVTMVNVSAVYTYDVDAAGTPVPTYSLTTSPTGMTIDLNTGVISWTPGAGQTGLSDVTVRATNVNGFDEQSFQVNVLGAPTVLLAVPVDWQENVLLGTVVRVEFSTSMDTAATEAAFRMQPMAGTPITGTFAWSNGDTVLTFVPDAMLDQFTYYDVTIGFGATNALGTPMAAMYGLSFLTRDAQDSFYGGCSAGGTTTSGPGLTIVLLLLVLAWAARRMRVTAAATGRDIH